MEAGNRKENELTHLDRAGRARMVDVSGKAETVREAVARGTISMNDAAYRAVREGSLEKGEALAVARVAGIAAAKRTSELIPLCHPLRLTTVAIDFSFDDATRSIDVEARAKAREATGVEMEALTAASVALLTLYDMAKALDKGMVISNIRLMYKSGGKSGTYIRNEE